MRIMSKPIDYNPYLGFKDDVIRENMRLVYSIANRFKHRCTATISYDDLVSEGVIGMINCFHRYDPEKFEGKVTRFSTFAVPTIQGDILQFLREKGALVKPPRSIQETAARIRWSKMRHRSPEEIAKVLVISSELAARTIRYMDTKSVVYLEQTVQSDGGSEITGFDQMGKADDFSGIMIQEFLSFLKPREREVIRLREAGKTQMEIGQIIGVSQTVISRSILKIRKQLREYMANPESKEFRIRKGG